MFSWSLADEHIAGRGFKAIMGGLYPVAKKEGGGGGWEVLVRVLSFTGG